MTIAESVKEALKISDKPLTPKEIYKIIISNNLYTFGAKQPEAFSE